MSLRERMALAEESSDRRIHETWGVFGNPFPFAGQMTVHPRMEDAVDDSVEARFREFEAAGRPSQVLLVEGTQGVGKTNLLNYYEEQFRDYYRDDQKFYVIRYYPDPEPTFDFVVRRVFQSLDQEHFQNIGEALATGGDDALDAARGLVRGHEIKTVLKGLQNGARDGGIEEGARLALEWFTGMRVLKRHREVLRVSFRLDTTESRTQALRDVLYVSEHLGLVKGVLLLMDELEKQDYSVGNTTVLRFLSAIRALVDALPRCLFLMLAMTRQARLRYFAMLPALASRLQHAVTLEPIGDLATARGLYAFYLDRARRTARADPRAVAASPGTREPFRDGELAEMFDGLRRRSEARGTEGVTQRDWLHRLHEEWTRRVERGLTA